MNWEVRWAFIQRIFSLKLQDDHLGGPGNVREWYPAGEHLKNHKYVCYTRRIGSYLLFTCQTTHPKE